MDKEDTGKEVLITSSVGDIQLEGFGLARNIEVFEMKEQV